MAEGHTDPEFLKNEAYAEAAALDTRIAIQARYGVNPRPWFEWLFERMERPAGSRVLELGCGPGDLWQQQQALPSGWRPVLSDLSHGMVSEARRRLGRRAGWFDFCVLDVQAIACPAEHFDVVIANGLLDHAPDRARALGEIWRVLRPGGLLYTSTGSRTHLEEINDLVQPFLQAEGGEQGSFGGAARRFGLENGERLLSPWFCEVRLFRYEDELVFEQPGPVLEYVLSEPQAHAVLSGARQEAFRREVEAVIARSGGLRVNVDKGLFEARRRER
jgi:SAM-dependent methyltransferase